MRSEHDQALRSLANRDTRGAPASGFDINFHARTAEALRIAWDEWRYATSNQLWVRKQCRRVVAPYFIVTRLSSLRACCWPLAAGVKLGPTREWLQGPQEAPVSCRTKRRAHRQEALLGEWARPSLGRRRLRIRQRRLVPVEWVVVGQHQEQPTP